MIMCPKCNRELRDGAKFCDVCGTYSKGEEGKPYQYKIREDSKEKIASDVDSVKFVVSDDGKKVVYLTSEGGLYLKCTDKEAEKIASDVSSLEYVSEDFSTMYYIKDGSLYKQVEGADRVKIADNFYEYISAEFYDSGEIYYVTSVTEEIPLKDYVIDDVKDADAAITEPDYPDYPDAPSSPLRQRYNSDAEYDAAYAAYEDAYEAWSAEVSRLQSEYIAANEKWYAKRTRDELREALKEATREWRGFSLCYYDGAEEVVITDDYCSNYLRCASEAPVIAYSVYDRLNVEKIKLSEVENISEIREKVGTALYPSEKWYIAVKENVTAIGGEEVLRAYINPSGTVAYYILLDDGYNSYDAGYPYGDLYLMSITDGRVGKAEVYDSDVSGVIFANDAELNDTKLLCLKDCKNGNVELYINKNKIDDDVVFGGPEIRVYYDLGKVFYFTDKSKGDAGATLKVCDGKESIKIADDVSYYSYSVASDGRVLYLRDYVYYYQKGELYEWFNGETRKIDDDVAAVFPFTSSEDGLYYENKHYGPIQWLIPNA